MSKEEKKPTPGNLHLWFHSGNVVKWNGDVYIVAQVRNDHLSLLPVDYENASSHPSFTWPTKQVYKFEADKCGCGGDSEFGHEPDCDKYEDVTDETKTVDTVVVIAPHVKAWINNTMRRAMKMMSKELS